MGSDERSESPYYLAAGAIAIFNPTGVVSRKVKGRSCGSVGLCKGALEERAAGAERVAPRDFDCAESSRKAESLFESLGEEARHEVPPLNQALLYHISHRYREAVPLYREALRHFKGGGGEVRLASTVLNLAALYQEIGKYRRSLKLYKASLNLARRVNDLPLIARVSNSLGNLFLVLGDYKESERFLYYSLALSKNHRIDPLHAHNKLLIGLLRLKKRDYRGAIRSFLQARRGFEQVEDRNLVLLATIQLASAYLEKNDYSLSREYLRKAWQGMRGPNRRELAMLATLLRARLSRVEKGRGRGAPLGLLGKVEDYFVGIGRKEMVWEVYYEMGKVYEQGGRVDLARVYFMKAKETIEELAEEVPKAIYPSYLHDRHRREVFASLSFLESESSFKGRSAVGGKKSVSIIGRSRRMLDFLESIDAVAKSDITALIEGETGTGKDLIARYIHQKSRRSDRPFVVIDCGALSPHLIESELFGHEEGAFTGAYKRKIGKFEGAKGGTICLDEVGNLSFDIQGKLLRFLQEKEFTRVGGNRRIHVDVRVISTTRKDLRREVFERRFREDLFYRLNAYVVVVPPLRERKEDIPLLVEHFLKKHTRMTEGRLVEIDDDALKALMKHNFPGNVRELENEVIRASVLAGKEGRIKKDMLSETVRGRRPNVSYGPTHGTLVQLLENTEREIVTQALEARGWSIGKTAKDLGVTRVGLYKKLKRLGIENPRARPATVQHFSLLPPLPPL